MTSKLVIYLMPPFSKSIIIMLRACAQAFNLRVSKKAERSAANHPRTAAQRYSGRKQLGYDPNLAPHPSRVNA
jgi:hypothetical protein